MSTAVIYLFIFLSALALVLSLYFAWQCLRVVLGADQQGDEPGPEAGP